MTRANDINVDEVRRRLQAHVRETGLSQREVARRVDVSATAINAWLQAKYRGDSARLAERIDRYLQAGLDVELLGEEEVELPPLVMTEAAASVLTIAKYAREMRDIAVLYGNPGVGKTIALRHFRAQNEGSVVMVTAAPHHHSTAGILVELSRAMGLPEPPRSRLLLVVFRDLERVLSSGRYTVIIDEAQHLSLDALEEIRSLHDATGAPFILSGNRDVHDRLHGGGSRGFAQLFSRVAIAVEIRGRVRPEDVRELAADVELDDASVAYLARVGQRGGALRSVSKTLRLASILADGGAITTAVLEGASALLMQGG